MAKRFTDTAKWDDPWFCALSNEDKLFWTYLCDKCDHAGIWKVNEALVRFYIGSDFVVDPSRLGGRVVVLQNGKWFVRKFVEFQYGELNPANRVHASVLKTLEKEGAYKFLQGAYGLSEGPYESSQGAKDKDKETDKDKDMDKGGGPGEGGAAMLCRCKRANISCESLVFGMVCAKCRLEEERVECIR